MTEKSVLIEQSELPGNYIYTVDINNIPINKTFKTEQEVCDYCDMIITSLRLENPNWNYYTEISIRDDRNSCTYNITKQYKWNVINYEIPDRVIRWDKLVPYSDDT